MASSRRRAPSGPVPDFPPPSRPATRGASPAGVTAGLLAAGLLAVGLLAAAAPALAQDTPAEPLPRVYVFTAIATPGQPALPDQAGRQQSVEELRAELGKKPGLLALVDARQDADVTIEILRREAPSPGQFRVTVRVKAALRRTGRQFQGEGASWKDAASLLGDAIGRWVNESFGAPAASALRATRRSSAP